MRLGAVFLLSAAALSLEVLLTRILAIAHWHHFAFMVISLALLGFGASGSFLALAGKRLSARPRAAFAVNALAFALSATGGVAIATRLPFNALAIFWNPVQLGWLLLIQLLLALPFFFAANGIGLALIAFPESVGRVYRADLAGAGFGALAIVGVLVFATPEVALVLIAATGVSAALVVGAEGAPLGRRFLVAALVLLAVLPWGFRPFPVSPYKGLAQILRLPGARIVTARSGPLARLDVVESSRVPLRHAPGLSLSASALPPEQLALFIDAEGPEAITRFDGRPESLAYLDQGTQALPYHLVAGPRVLLLGLGGGTELLRAILHRARAITVVESNGDLVRLLAETHAAFAGRPLARPEVVVHRAEPRAFLAGDGGEYDLIVVPSLGTGVGGGLHGLGETTSHTVEAFRAYLAHLAPGGWFVVTEPLRLPPRAVPKLVSTAEAALRDLGIGGAGRRMVAIRGWGTVTLAIGRDVAGAREIAELKTFTRTRGFDIVYYPGMARDEANRRNRLAAPMLHDAIVALVSGPDAARRFRARHPFDLRPAVDDRPYASDFFRWRGLAEVWRVSRRGGAVLIDWGQLILWASLAQAVPLGALLILLPLGLRGGRAVRAAGGGRALLFFALIGAGFLMIEIPSIERFVLVLGHPLYAVAGVLAAFLVSAGIGAGLAPRLAAWSSARPRRPAALDLALGGILLAAFSHLGLLPALAAAAGVLPPAAIVVVALAWIAPLGIAMGLPFPLVLARLRVARPELVPWAWGMNGFASVGSAILAKLLAMSFGFQAVIWVALGCYLAAAWLARGIPAASPE